jgi:hypothetical protein
MKYASFVLRSEKCRVYVVGIEYRPVGTTAEMTEAISATCSKQTNGRLS